MIDNPTGTGDLHFGRPLCDVQAMINVHRTRAIVLALVGPSLACRDGDGVAPPPACTGSVDLTVVNGTTPTFSWAPECGVGRLVVGRVIDEFSSEIVWEITSDRSRIAPAVTYGVDRRGLRVEHAPEPLVPGTAYRIHLTPAGEGLVVVWGGATFTP